MNSASRARINRLISALDAAEPDWLSAADAMSKIAAETNGTHLQPLTDWLATALVEEDRDQARRIASVLSETLELRHLATADEFGRAEPKTPSMSRAEEAARIDAAQLRRSQQTFFNLVQNTPFGLYVVDEKFRLRQVSAGAQKVFQNVSPLLGRDFAEIMRMLWPKTFAEEAIGLFRHTLETGEPYRSTQTTELRADTNELESYDWQIERIRLPHGELGVVCYFYDLSPERRVQSALRESEERLRSAAEAAQFGIYDANLKTMEVYWSPEARALLGLAPDSPAGGHTRTILNFVHPEDREQVRSAILESFDPGGDGQFHSEHRIVRPDGEIRWLMAKGRTTFEDDDGRKAVRTSGTFVDVTERKRLEEDRRVIAAELSEANKRKDEFLALLAHELRNPLSPIQHGLEVMRMAPGMPERLKAVREVLERQTQQLVSLVDDLLDVSRITRGKLELRKSLVEVHTAVEAAVEATRPLTEAANHQLLIQTPSSRVEFYADPSRLTQILSNLINNSAKYTPAGGKIEFTAEASETEVVFTVKDNGRGIPADKLERVFDLFAQIGASNDRGPGLGIGLTLVKRLVELHGGSIEAQSEGMNNGSEFQVRLPIGAGPDEQGAESQSAASGLGDRDGVRVLVVDDNESAAEMLGVLVGMLGHEVRRACDGAAAVRTAEEFRPDIILMDLGMPVMDGYEAAREIRKRPWGKATRMVAVSGWGQREDKRRSKEAGFDDHVVKPLQRSDLKRLLQRNDT